MLIPTSFSLSPLRRICPFFVLKSKQNTSELNKYGTWRSRAHIHRSFEIHLRREKHGKNILFRIYKRSVCGCGHSIESVFVLCYSVWWKDSMISLWIDLMCRSTYVLMSDISFPAILCQLRYGISRKCMRRWDGWVLKFSFLRRPDEWSVQLQMPFQSTSIRNNTQRVHTIFTSIAKYEILIEINLNVLPEFVMAIWASAGR